MATTATATDPNTTDYGAIAREAIDQAMQQLKAVDPLADNGAQMLLLTYHALITVIGALGAMEMQLARCEAALTGFSMLMTGLDTDMEGQ